MCKGEDAGAVKRVRLRCGPDLLDFGLPEDLRENAELLASFKELEHQVAINPLQFFCPHGTEKTGVVVSEDDGTQIDLSADARGWPVVSALEWLNDDAYDICMNKSPNQVGKTCLAIAKACFRIIRCGVDWVCFKKHGVERPEWRGPKTLLVMGYDRGQLERVAWPELQKWLPDEELGAYRSPARGGTKDPAWDRRPKINLLKSKSEIFFLTYEQKSTSIAGVKADIVVPDEQMPASHWSELRVRGRTRGGLKVYFPYTPHQVEGRTDTGAGSFLADIWSGENTYGQSVLRTRVSVDDVPDYLITPTEKEKARQDCIVIPKRLNDQAALRRGRARYYGTDEEGSSLFYPEFMRDVHVIDWTYEDTKRFPGKYSRFIDYGFSAPTACIWVWISVHGDFFIYDEYYVRNVQAYEHAQAIIKKSGNLLHLVDRNSPIEHGTMQQYAERFPRHGGQKFERTELDWHSFAREGGSMSLADYFRVGGLNVSQSTKEQIVQRSKCLRAMLRVDPHKKHMVTGEFGAPRLYIARHCSWMIWEIERCMRDTRIMPDGKPSMKEGRQSKDDHLIDCAEYMAVRYSSAVGVSQNRMKKGIIYR